MRQILLGINNLAFGNGLAVGDLTADLNTLAAGAMTVARTDNDLLAVRTAPADPIFATALANDTRLFFAVNNGTGPGAASVINKSNVINPNTFRYFRTNYVAPVAKAQAIGGNANNALPLVANLPNFLGQYMTLTVMDLAKETWDHSRTRHYEVLVESNSTVVGLINALVAQINADPDRIVNAVATSVVAGSETITCTAINAGHNFRILGSDLFEPMPIVTTIAHVGGTGLAGVVAELEKDYASQLGYNEMALVKDQLYTQGFLADSTVNYDIFVCNWRAYDDGTQLGSTDTRVEQTLVIAVATGNVVILAQLVEVLNAIVAGAAANFA